MIVLTWRRINNYRYKININYFIVCIKLEKLSYFDRPLHVW